MPRKSKERMSDSRKAYLKCYKQQVHEERPVSASEKKLGGKATPSHEITCKSISLPSPVSGHRTIDVCNIQALLHESAVCSSCKKGKLNVIENSAARHGLFTPLSFRCEYCLRTVPLQRPTITACDSRFLEVNRRSVLAFRSFGKGKAAVDKFCAILNIPPPLSYGAFSAHVQAICEATANVCDNKLQDAVSEVKEFVLATDPELTDQLVLDIEVSCDGTWARRGYTSLYGCVCVIAVATGKVLDFEVMSRYCKSCDIWSKRDPESLEYKQWKASHETECMANFSQSSKAMESAGAVQLWKRSVSKYGLRYMAFIGDGDSAAYKSVVSAKPYGEGVENCQKRLCWSCTKNNGNRTTQSGYSVQGTQATRWQNNRGQRKAL